MKITKKSIVCGLLIAISSIASASSEEKSNNLIFTVLRKAHSLKFIGTECCKNDDLQKIFSDLNIPALYELSEGLVAAENTDGPATDEKIRLETLYLADEQEILEAMSEDKLDIEQQDVYDSFRKLWIKIKANLTPEERHIIFTGLYESQLEDFKLLIQNNQDTWDKVQELAKNEFMINSETQKCRTFQGKDFCTPKKFAANKIKSLSEIIPYINSLGKNPIISQASLNKATSTIELNSNAEEITTSTTGSVTESKASVDNQTHLVSTAPVIEKNSNTEEISALTADSTTEAKTNEETLVATPTPAIEENSITEEVPPLTTDSAKEAQTNADTPVITSVPAVEKNPAPDEPQALTTDSAKEAETNVKTPVVTSDPAAEKNPAPDQPQALTIDSAKEAETNVKTPVVKSNPTVEKNSGSDEAPVLTADSTIEAKTNAETPVVKSNPASKAKPTKEKKTPKKAL